MSREATTSRKGREKHVLTDLDWAILDELTHDPHASTRVLAERLNLPMPQVAARVRDLDRRNASQVLAVLDLKAAGQSFCFIQICVRGRPLAEVAAELALIPEALMVSALSGGPHDLLVLIRFAELTVLQHTIYGQLANVRGVSQLTVAIVLDVPVFHARYVAMNGVHVPLEVTASMNDLALNYDAADMDELDRCIVSELQQNARKSINAIARKYEINASTIRYRIRSLESRGLMRFITVLAPPVLGLTTFTLVEVQVEANRISEVIQALSHKDWLPQLFLCAGTANLMGIALSDSPASMKRITSEELGVIPGVIKVTDSTLIETYKSDLRWAQKFT